MMMTVSHTVTDLTWSWRGEAAFGDIFADFFSLEI